MKRSREDIVTFSKDRDPKKTYYMLSYTHRGMMCIRVFISVSIYTYMNICAYIVFLKKYIYILSKYYLTILLVQSRFTTKQTITKSN
jgi:hypothetical protein